MNATGTKLFGCRLPAAFTGGYRRGKIYRGGKRHGSRHGGYRDGKKFVDSERTTFYFYFLLLFLLVRLRFFDNKPTFTLMKYIKSFIGKN